MKNVKFKEWILAAGVRALKTVAQTAIGLIPAAVSIDQVNWVVVLGTASLAGLTSILTSLCGLPELKINSEDEAEG